MKHIEETEAKEQDKDEEDNEDRKRKGDEQDQEEDEQEEWETRRKLNTSSGVDIFVLKKSPHFSINILDTSSKTT